MAEIKTERVIWEADLTGAEHSVLPPVRLCGRAKSGAFHVQDYLTPDEARALAAQLIDTAQTVESQRTEALVDA